MSNFDIQVIR